ncbi:MAG: hypothetical protein RH948_07065 [Cyclobacteriaceae bacterium]
MKLLFLSYWGVGEGLTSATVIPHLRILSGLSSVEQIIFCSIEREAQDINSLEIEKVKHFPLFSRRTNSLLLTKFADFTTFPKIIVGLCKEFRVDVIICRSPMAGAIGYLVWQKIKMPYIVESFEPHAVSMYESGVWKWFDPRLWIQKYFETRQKKTADKILPVSNHYCSALRKEGIDPSRLITMPCCVPIRKFEFKGSARVTKRAHLGIKEHETVGIYVGKFGGIYYDGEAFKLFRSAFDFFGSTFKLMILSADDRVKIMSRLVRNKLPLDRIFFDSVAHADVPEYLSAADFAFSTIKPVPSRLYCSPIKNGEYWANGLPILTEKGIGDDSDIIADEGGGVILDMDNRDTAFAAMRNLVETGREKLAEQISQLAYKHRRLALVEKVYASLFADKDLPSF